jgi:hypothetical protein
MAMGVGGGNKIEDNDNNKDAVRKGKSLSSYLLYNTRAVVFVNMGSNCNLAECYCSSSSSASSLGGSPAWDKTKNRVTGKNVVLFNNRPVKDGEVPSNGDDLSGNDKMSNNDDNSGSAGDDWDVS